MAPTRHFYTATSEVKKQRLHETILLHCYERRKEATIALLRAEERSNVASRRLFYTAATSEGKKQRLLEKRDDCTATSGEKKQRLLEKRDDFFALLRVEKRSNVSPRNETTSLYTATSGRKKQRFLEKRDFFIPVRAEERSNVSFTQLRAEERSNVSSRNETIYFATSGRKKQRFLDKTRRLLYERREGATYRGERWRNEEKTEGRKEEGMEAKRESLSKKGARIREEGVGGAGANRRPLERGGPHTAAPYAARSSPPSPRSFEISASIYTRSRSTRLEVTVAPVCVYIYIYIYIREAEMTRRVISTRVNPGVGRVTARLPALNYILNVFIKLPYVQTIKGLITVVRERREWGAPRRASSSYLARIRAPPLSLPLLL